jgi:hypothetical protein
MTVYSLENSKSHAHTQVSPRFLRRKYKRRGSQRRGAAGRIDCWLGSLANKPNPPLPRSSPSIKFCSEQHVSSLLAAEELPIKLCFCDLCHFKLRRPVAMTTSNFRRFAHSAQIHLSISAPLTPTSTPLTTLCNMCQYVINKFSRCGHY